MGGGNAGRRRLGRYELVRPIGSGATGVVWEADLYGPERYRSRVAVKLLAGLDSADPEARRSLAREARLGALLQHPNIVSILQFGEVDGTWFLAMELVSGASAADLLAGGPLSAVAVLDLGVQTAAGLHHAHRLRVGGRPLGLVHRDIKPANLLVDRSGAVKIADLGIATFADDTDGFAAGTHGYMPPEQLDDTAGPAADVFALGVTLYRLATGRRPFGGGPSSEAEVRRVEAHLGDPAFLRPAELAVPGLAEVLRRCLRHAPAQRWRDAGRLREALLRLRGRQAPGTSLRDAVAAHEATGAGPAADDAAPTIVVSAPALPLRRDRFFGRADELADLLRRVRAGERLITLVGLGGMGKTRLAVEAADLLGADLAGGARFFDLSDVGSAEALCFTMARTLALVLGPDPVEAIGRLLAARGRTVWVLDSLDRAAPFLEGPVRRWLALAPEATLLCTGRVVLGLDEEHLVQLGPLSTDDGVALFLDRAPQPATEAARAAVRELVSAVDGMVLAIELLAAHSRTTDLETLRGDIALHLASQAGTENLTRARQRTVRAALAWSWQRLAPSEQAALQQLCVCEGGFDPKAAEAIVDLSPWPEAGWAMDVLQRLVDASLVRVDPETGRFRMLRVVQAHGKDQLDADARVAAEERHGGWYAQLGSAAALQALKGPGGVARHEAMGRELDNLLAAYQRALGRGDSLTATGAGLAAAEALGLRGPLVAAVPVLERLRDIVPPERRISLVLRTAEALRGAGRARESLEVLRRDRSLPASQDARARMLRSLGRSHQVLGEMGEARRCFEASLVTFRAEGNARAEAIALLSLGMLHAGQGRLDTAERFYREALRLFRVLGDQRAEGQLRNNLASTLMSLGRLDESREHMDAAVRTYRQVGDRRGECIQLGNIGILLARQGRYTEATTWMLEALEGHGEVGEVRSEGVVLGNLALMSHALGRFEASERYCEASLERHREAGNRRSEGIVLGTYGELCVDVGELERAAPLLDAAEAIHVDTGNRSFLSAVICARGEMAVAEGRLGEAAAHFARAARLGVEGQDASYQARALGRWGGCLALSGRLHAAWETTRRAVEVAERFNYPPGHRLWSGQLGALAARFGRSAAMEDHAAGLAHMRTSGDALAVLRLQLAGAEVGLERGDPARAAAALDEARFQVAQLGLGPRAALAVHTDALQHRLEALAGLEAPPRRLPSEESGRAWCDLWWSPAGDPRDWWAWIAVPRHGARARPEPTAFEANPPTVALASPLADAIGAARRGWRGRVGDSEVWAAQGDRGSAILVLGPPLA